MLSALTAPVTLVCSREGNRQSTVSMDDQSLLILDEGISEFLLNSTDFNPQTNLNAMAALYAELTHVFCDGRNIAYPNPLYIVSGSVAELNMKTPLSCFSDVDIMLRSNCDVVIPRDGQLPKAECLRRMARDVRLYETEPTLFPCYVLLNDRGTMSLDPADDSRYILSDHGRSHSAGPVMLPRTTVTTRESDQKGPAIKCHRGTHQFYYYGHRQEIEILRDSVLSMFCPYWPTDADDFKKRTRNSGWPNEATVRRVVDAGCDLVQVSHPFYRTNPYQWRWSFSRAEILLIRSWEPVQKIVYHLLRYLRKNLDPNCRSVLKTYFMKTVMLWNCERRAPEFWKRSRLMQITTELIVDLVQYIDKRYLPNYFVPRCNLLHDEDEINDESGERFRALSAILNPFTHVETTIRWFHQNYVYRATVVNIQTNPEAMIFRSPSEFLVCIDLFSGPGAWGSFRRVPNMCKLALHSLKEIDYRLISCFKASILLHVAMEFQEHDELPWHWLVDLVLEVIVDPDINTLKRTDIPDVYEVDNSETYFSKAVYIARILEKHEIPEAKDLLVELMESCLVKSLEYEDLPKVHGSVAFFLAILKCRQRNYRQAAQLCRTVINKTDRNQCSSKTIPLEILPVLGFHEHDKAYEGMCKDLGSGDGDACRVTPTVAAFALLHELLASNPDDGFNLPCHSIPFQKRPIDTSAVADDNDDDDDDENADDNTVLHSCKASARKLRCEEAGKFPESVFVRTILEYQRRGFDFDNNSSSACRTNGQVIGSKDFVYSRFQTGKEIIFRNLVDSLLRTSASHLTQHLIRLNEIPDRSPMIDTVAQQYMALYYLKSGAIEPAHRISEGIINYWERQRFLGRNPMPCHVHVMCSPPCCSTTTWQPLMV